jgi:hypothetical protein
MMITSPRMPRLASLLCGAAMAMLAAVSGGQAQAPFKTPTDATTALVEAVRRSDAKQLREILGAGARDILSSGDEVSDATDRKRFLDAFENRHSLSESGDRAMLLVGADDFPFPIPLVRKREGWRFDTAAGRTEILARRIGRNELAAIQASLAVLDAQQEYAAKDRTGQGSGIYAQRIVSRAGMKDGLFWGAPAGEEQSPLGELAAQAAAEGYVSGERPQPFHGYIYKILRRQGRAAPGGAIDYVARGKMIGGFALLAYPAEYGRSGVMSFMLNHAGTIYQKDLGPATSRLAARINSFNPDKGWEQVTPVQP